jgi:hypothetical protein
MKETLMEFATREANDNEKHGRFNLDYQDGIFYGIQEGAKWQKESMYDYMEKYVEYVNMRNECQEFPLSAKDWFEQLKTHNA